MSEYLFPLKVELENEILSGWLPSNQKKAPTVVHLEGFKIFLMNLFAPHQVYWSKPGVEIWQPPPGSNNRPTTTNQVTCSTFNLGWRYGWLTSNPWFEVVSKYALSPHLGHKSEGNWWVQHQGQVSPQPTLGGEAKLLAWACPRQRCLNLWETGTVTF